MLTFLAGCLVGGSVVFVACAGLAQLSTRAHVEDREHKQRLVEQLYRDRKRLMLDRLRARELEARVRAAVEFAAANKDLDLRLAEVVHALRDADLAEVREWRREWAQRELAAPPAAS